MLDTTFTTADGWHVTLEATYVSFEALPGEGCNYKEADFGGVVYEAHNEVQTLIRGAEARGCRYFITLRGALRTPRIGPGATNDDRLFFLSSRDALENPYSLRYRGVATFGDQRIVFDFGVASPGGIQTFYANVPEDSKVNTSFTMTPEEIFRAASSSSFVGPLLFTPIWYADQRGNKDGFVTNEELDRVRVDRQGNLTVLDGIALSDYFSLRSVNLLRLRTLNVPDVP